MLWMFQIKVLVNVQNISYDSATGEICMARQMHHVAIHQNLHIIRLFKLNFYLLFLSHTASSGPPEQVLLLFSLWASLGRNRSPVRRQVWLWYAASWAGS
jgi:hypothetical protein